MSKYVKGFNKPFLKYQSGNVTRVIDITDISEIDYYRNSAYIFFKSRSSQEIYIEVAKEIDEFLMNYKTANIKLPGGSDMSMVFVGEETLDDWLNKKI